MALTTGQKRALHSAARQADVTEAERRTIQWNVGGFHSAADRTASRYGFICCMAFYERQCSGRLRGCSEWYWRDQQNESGPLDALRFACRREAAAMGWTDGQLDHFLASEHMSSARHGAVGEAPAYWLSRLLEALRTIRRRIERRRPA